MHRNCKGTIQNSIKLLVWIETYIVLVYSRFLHRQSGINICITVLIICITQVSLIAAYRKTILNISTAHIHINITSKVITHSLINRKMPFVPVPQVTKKKKRRPLCIYEPIGGKLHYTYIVRLCLDSHIYQLIWHINLWLFWYCSVAIEVPYAVAASSAAIRIVDASHHAISVRKERKILCKSRMRLICDIICLCFICAYLLW